MPSIVTVQPKGCVVRKRMTCSRDKYGLRTHFPSPKYVGFAEESSEEYSKKRAANFNIQARSEILKKETSKLRDTLRVFNSFRFNIPRIQGEIWNVIPLLVAGPENAELYTHGQSEHDIEIQKLTAESRIIQDLFTLLQGFNAKLSKIQGTLNDFATAQGTSRSPIGVYPQIRLDSPDSVSTNYEEIGFLSPAMDTSCTQKLTVQDYLNFARNHNKAYPATSRVELGPAAKGFISSQEHVADIGVESLVTEMSAFRLPV
ncbi:hypothetical protein RIB2604_01200080 [Aspergillus luchuensis]|uniref:Uncharacterized protein n=1 Tax=Aspergillus kawachii TaxID=1069201 RepID=A0A146F6U7_ASPKA|nr:hypothetical protein RIB2604_01200080 [Aspergillus luchuensis]